MSWLCILRWVTQSCIHAACDAGPADSGVRDPDSVLPPPPPPNRRPAPAAALSFVLHLDVHLGEIVAKYGMATYGILFAIVFAETGRPPLEREQG